ncbi:MAG: hypothetical protein MJ252_03880 [archaeon]|nr:hypothetical protein [archaeon]
MEKHFPNLNSSDTPARPSYNFDPSNINDNPMNESKEGNDCFIGPTSGRYQMEGLRNNSSFINPGFSNIINPSPAIPGNSSNIFPYNYLNCNTPGTPCLAFGSSSMAMGNYMRDSKMNSSLLANPSPMMAGGSSGNINYYHNYSNIGLNGRNTYSGNFSPNPAMVQTESNVFGRVNQNYTSEPVSEETSVHNQNSDASSVTHSIIETKELVREERDLSLLNLPNSKMYTEDVLPKLQNIVSTADLKCKLDLRRIALSAKNAEYNPKRFAAVIMRIKDPKTTALIFSSGKMVCTGARSEEDSRKAARQYAKNIKKLGFEVKFSSFKIQNIVGSCDVKFQISLEGLSMNNASCSKKYFLILFLDYGKLCLNNIFLNI